MDKKIIKSDDTKIEKFHQTSSKLNSYFNK